MDTDTSVRTLTTLQEEIHKIEQDIYAQQERLQLLLAIKDIHKGIGLIGGIYRKLERLSDYEQKWKDSFWGKNRLLLEQLGGYTLEAESLTYARHIQENNPYSPDSVFYFNSIVLVEAVLTTKDGTYLLLSDPFGSIMAKPEETMIKEELVCHLQIYCIANLGVLYYDDTIRLHRLTPITINEGNTYETE